MAQSARAPVIAAASDLQFALAEIAAAFRSETGQEVRLSMGSSGNFARQIRQGAPFDIYLSADEDYVLDLARDGYLQDEGALYAIGRIVLIVPRGSPLKADGALDDLADALADGRLKRFAIANPEHAPYGKRAEEALRHRGLWENVKPMLVYGENVSQAAQFATSGNSQGGIIAYSLATRPGVFILDEPTKGIDIGSKAAVHEFMAELAAEGLAVILVSSEIPEVLGMSDRVIVMREGRIAAEFEGEAMTPENLVRAAAGIEEGHA